MLPWRRRRANAPPELTSKSQTVSQAREASTLLAFLAGGFAAEVAALWPAPHTAFVLAPVARRQLAFLALSLQCKADGWTTGGGFARLALEAPLRVAIRELAPGAPPGLARALGRLGETAWAPPDYGLLLQRLADPRTAKVLRHAPAIDARDVRVLSSLPTALVATGGGLLRLTEDQSVLLAECFSGIERRDGTEAASRVAQRWAKAPDAAAIFRQVAVDLTPAAATPPHPGTPRLGPLATRDALADAGRRYRNCLEGRTLDGWNHYYEWFGDPGAVVSISRDPLFGWRLDEALSVGNAPVAPQVWPALEAELRAIGVHVGRSAWELQELVRGAALTTFALPTARDVLTDAFDV